MCCKRLLAFFSILCPICNFIRRNPNSKFAQMMQKREKLCPACKAYKEIYGKEDKTQDGGESE